ncbi:MAG: hypothetical protein ACR2L2_15235 [Acidobacteriota bacterium]
MPYAAGRMPATEATEPQKLRRERNRSHEGGALQALAWRLATGDWRLATGD